MSKIDRTKIDRALETVCQTGCGEVRGVIQELQEGQPPRAVQSLSRDEQDLLLKELIEVMNAYQRACPT